MPVSFKQKLANLKALDAADNATAKAGIRKALGDAQIKHLATTRLIDASCLVGSRGAVLLSRNGFRAAR